MVCGPNRECVVRHFSIDQEHAYVQYSTKMTQSEFEQMTNLSTQACINKIFILALDVSQSMKGEPINALKIGA